jgi:peptidylprolyl isomerase
MRSRFAGTLLMAAVCASLLATGCGGSSSANEVTYSAAAAERPKPRLPQGPPTRKLIVKDLIKGTGAPAKKGKVVRTHYVVGLYETGKETESFWHPNNFFGFELGSSQGLPSWEKGIPGMRVGGRRALIFRASPSQFPLGSEPGDTVVYVIDLVEVHE